MRIASWTATSASFFALMVLSGSARAGSDFNQDSRDDLAIGVQQEGIGSTDLAGAVNVLVGAAGGLSATGDQIWHQNSPGILEIA
jgi:hypothetical protein